MENRYGPGPVSQKYFAGIRSIMVVGGEIIIEAFVHGKSTPDKITLFVVDDELQVDFDPSEWGQNVK